MNKKTTTIAYYAAFITLGMTTAVLGPTLLTLAENANVSLAQIGVLFPTSAVGYMLGSYFSGIFYDNRPGHPQLRSYILLIVGALILFPLGEAFWMLALLAFAMGVGHGGIDVGGNTLIVWLHGKAVGPWMNGLHFMFGIGAFIAPIIVGQLGNITWAYWTLAAISLPTALVFIRRASPTQPDQPDEADTRATGASSVRLVALLTLFLLLYVGAEVTVGGWIFSYATVQGLVNEANGSYLTSAFWGALTIGRLISIPIAMRIRPARVLFVDLLGVILSAVVILFNRENAILLWAGTIGLGAFMASIFPTTINFAENRIALTGMVNRWFFIGASLGGMSIPWLVGQFFESRGPQIMLELIIFVFLLQIALLAIVQRETA